MHLLWPALLLVAVSLILAVPDRYSEHILVHHIDSQYSAATFVAAAKGSLSVHLQTFPGPVASLFDTYPLASFRLTLTRGRWRKQWCGCSSFQAVQNLTSCSGATVQSHDSTALALTGASREQTHAHYVQARASLRRMHVQAATAPTHAAGALASAQCRRLGRRLQRRGYQWSTPLRPLPCGAASPTQWRASSAPR
jgi:hypothetical protein